MEKEFIYIAAVAISLMSLAMSITLLFVARRKKEREKEQETKAELSYMRDFVEKKLFDINYQLTNNEARWKDMNHLLLSYKPNVDQSYFELKSNINDSFFRNFRIEPKEIKVEKNLVFFLTPFHQIEKETFSTVKTACEKVGLRCIRGDEEFIKGDIFSSILKMILRSRFIIANINGRNPNVFYELGIAQAIGKPTLLISKSIEETPFDITSQNVIIYNSPESLDRALVRSLQDVLINQS